MKLPKTLRIFALVAVIVSLFLGLYGFILTVPLLYAISKINQTEDVRKEKALVVCLLYPLSAAIVVILCGVFLFGYVIFSGAAVSGTEPFGPIVILGNALIVAAIVFCFFLAFGFVKVFSGRFRDVPISYRVVSASAVVSVFAVIFIELAMAFVFLYERLFFF